LVFLISADSQPSEKRFSRSIPLNPFTGQTSKVASPKTSFEVWPQSFQIIKRFGLHLLNSGAMTEESVRARMQLIYQAGAFLLIEEGNQELPPTPAATQLGSGRQSAR